MLKKWNELPDFMRTDEVRPYYERLEKKKISLALKRVLDIVLSITLLIALFPFMTVTAVIIVLDSPGGAFYRQERITRYGKKFRIHKFRTMVRDAEKKGSSVTVDNDIRITKAGAVLRKYRIDEFPQLIDILTGNMSFVGARPEIEKYVSLYTPEMMATLLLPAGVTSEASIRYKDEYKLLCGAEDADKVYAETILPAKMTYNLEAINKFGIIRETTVVFRTVLAVLNKKI